MIYLCTLCVYVYGDMMSYDKIELKQSFDRIHWDLDIIIVVQESFKY